VWRRIVNLLEGVGRKKEATSALVISDRELADLEVDGGSRRKTGCEGEQWALSTFRSACEPGELLFEQESQRLELLLLDPQRRGLLTMFYENPKRPMPGLANGLGVDLLEVSEIVAAWTRHFTPSGQGNLSARDS
jgi:hypothetical protein